MGFSAHSNSVNFSMNTKYFAFTDFDATFFSR